MKKNKRYSNTKKNLSRRESFQLWLDSHKFLGFFLILGLILAIGLSLNLIFVFFVWCINYLTIGS